MKVQYLIFLQKNLDLAKEIDNKFVSTSTVSRSDGELIKDFIVKLKTATSNLRNTGSTCWKFIGFLYNVSRKIFIDADENNSASMSRYYSAPWLNEQKAIGDKSLFFESSQFFTNNFNRNFVTSFECQTIFLKEHSPRLGK